jgi:hypothetical protein
MTEEMKLFCAKVATFIVAEGERADLEVEDMVQGATAALVMVALQCAKEGHEADVILDVIGMLQEAGVQFIEVKRGNFDESDSVQRYN